MAAENGDFSSEFRDNTSMIRTLSDKSKRRSSESGYENEDVINEIAKNRPPKMEKLSESPISNYMAMDGRNRSYNSPVSPKLVVDDFDEQLYQNHTPTQSVVNLAQFQREHCDQLYQNDDSPGNVIKPGNCHDGDQIYQNTEFEQDSIYCNASNSDYPDDISNYMPMRTGGSAIRPISPGVFRQNVPPPAPHHSPAVKPRYINQHIH